VSQEGVREHTYELLQDYTINMGGWSKRVRRGQRYHGRIFVDHAEIDISGVSYTVPSGILSAPKKIAELAAKHHILWIHLHRGGYEEPERLLR
jgi:hypothetical protein